MKTNTITAIEQLDALASHYSLPKYSDLLSVLDSVKRCPGIYQTDQVSGLPFSELIKSVELDSGDAPNHEAGFHP